MKASRGTVRLGMAVGLASAPAFPAVVPGRTSNFSEGSGWAALALSWAAAGPGCCPGGLVPGTLGLAVCRTVGRSAKGLAFWVTTIAAPDRSSGDLPSILKKHIIYFEVIGQAHVFGRKIGRDLCSERLWKS